MAVFRIERTRDYTVMSNHHLRNANLSLKAKGLLSMMLSLPEDWNYTTRGLAKICKEGVDAIGAALRELEAAGYIVRHKLRDRQGRISDTEYVIYEQPQLRKPDTDSPDTENPYMDKPDTEKPAELNIEKSNTQKQNIYGSSTDSIPFRDCAADCLPERKGRDAMSLTEIQNQKIFLENYARGQHLTNIRHYIDDDESGRFFDRSAYSRMMDDVENGKIGVCIMKDLTRWGRDYLQVGNAMEIFRRNNVRFIAVNNGIDSEKPDTLEFAPFINIMSEWYAKDISKKVKTGIKTKGMSGKPIVTEAPYGYVKDPDNKDFWIIDEEAAEVVRLIFRLFIGGKNRNQIAVHLKNEQIPTPTFYMKDRGRGTCKNKTLNEDNRCKWNKVTLTNILTRQEYCGDVVNFKTTKHFRDKHNHYVDRSQWHITENVHEPIISRSDFETVQRILENASVRRPNGDGEIHPLSGLLFCKDCGAKMHIRIDYRNGGKRHVAFCSEYHKGKAKNPKCHSPHIMDADLLMQTIAEVLKKIEDYSISNRAEFEVLVKKNLAMQQTDQSKKQQKRIPQITTRLEQIDKVLNKLYEDNALGTIPQDRYEQMSQKYSEEYYALKAELATLQEQLSAYENAGGRAQKFLKLTERHAAFTDLTPAILNEFISRIEVHERDQKRARYAIQHISIYFNYIGKFENEVTQLAEPTEQEIRQMREEIEEAKKEKSRAYHRQYSREYRARNLEKQREYDRMKAREYRARRKAQAAAAQPTQ